MPHRFKPADFGIGRLFGYMRDAVVVANAATEQIVLWNAAAAEIFGYSEPEALGLPLHCLVPESLRDAHRAGIARYQETGTGALIEAGRPLELTGLRKDGTEVPVELTLTCIEEMDADGNRYALAVVRDITDRKRAEEARLELHNADLQRKHALQVNDSVVQGLVVAKMALEGGNTPVARQAVAAALKNAKAMVGNQLAEIERRHGPLKPGDLVRNETASAGGDDL